MFFINTPYNLIFKPENISLATASSIIVEFAAPFYRHSGQWTATADGQNAVVNISIPKEGTYTMQVVAVIDGITRRSSIVQINFQKSPFQ